MFLTKIKKFKKYTLAQILVSKKLGIEIKKSIQLGTEK